MHRRALWTIALLLMAASLLPFAIPAGGAEKHIRLTGSEVLVHGFSSSKLISFAFAEWIYLSTEETTKGMIKKLESGKYRGFLLATRCPELTDKLTYTIYRFLMSGGRVGLFLYAGADIRASRKNIDRLKYLLEVDLGAESIMKPPSPGKGEDLTPLWKDLKVGYEKCAFDYDMYLLPQKGIFEEKAVKSESTGFMRCISAYRRLGLGELLVMTVPYNAVFENDFIDQYDNRKASVLLARWLAGKKRYK